MNNNIKDTTSLVFVKGKNLINPSTLQNGSLNVDNGQYVSLQNAVVTDFIPVEPGDYVIKFFDTTNSPVTYRMCYYDENKNLIFGMNYTNTSEHSFYISSAKYIRFCMAFASFSNLTVDDIVAAKPQLEQNTISTTYEPYQEKKIMIKNKNGVFGEFYNEDKLNKTNYSTTEQLIGTWIDGKKLYRKMYQFKLPQCTTSGTPAIENHTINSASFAFIEFGFIYSDFINAPMPYFTRQNPSQNIGYDLTSPNTLRIWNSFKDWNSANILVSVLYTKTTD